jgi:hypothetical protein
VNATQHLTVLFLHESNGSVSAYLADLPGVYPSADTLGVGALLGRKTSRVKAASSRANRRKGGRPRTTDSP